MNAETEVDIVNAFKNGIIPLLKEYFYNDYGKMRMVLGDGIVKKTKGINEQTFFAVNDEDFIADKVVYTIVDNDVDLLAGIMQIVKSEPQ